jgi:tetratricopeptide (TPR) repeat protein
MHIIRFIPQGIRLAQIAAIFFIVGSCELTRAQARPDSPPATMKQPGTDQNPQAESELRAGTELTRGGHFAEAIAHLLEAQGRVSNEYAAEFNLALCYVATGQFQKAIPVLSRLRGEGSENASVENLLAQAYAGNGQAGEAFEALQRATAFTPRDEKLYLFVADAFLGRQEHAQSLRVIELGLQHLPESARLHYERGYLLSMLDAFDGAKTDFERAARLAPRSEIGYLATAQENLFGGNLAEAIRVARTATAEGKQDYQLLAILGEALIRVGASPGQVEFVEARDALEKSVAARPNYASSQIGLGHVDLLDGRLEAAIEHLEIGRRLSPQNPAVYSLLAAAYRRSGRPGQAEAMLTILAKLNQEQAQRIRTAPGDSKAIPGASGASRGEQKPQAGEKRNDLRSGNRFRRIWQERGEGPGAKPLPSSMARI